MTEIETFYSNSELERHKKNAFGPTGKFSVIFFLFVLLFPSHLLALWLIEGNKAADRRQIFLQTYNETFHTVLI